MQIRPYEPRDRAALERMHAGSGLGYPLPELDDPIVAVKLVLEDDSGRMRMAGLLRLTAESFLLMDRERGRFGPRDRWQAFLALHEAVRREALAIGLQDVQAYVPPRVAKHFARRLALLGWLREPWEPWTRDTILSTFPDS